MEESCVKSQRQQSGAQKLRGLMLDALMTNKLSEVAKCHLEKVVAKQLEEIVKNKCFELIRSKQMEDVICNLLRMLNIRATADEPSAPPPPPSSPTLLLQVRCDKIPMLFADKKLGDQLESSMEVTLVDASGKVVSEGKEASASLKLVLLDADARGSGEAMTWEEFKKAELTPRENKPPLLTGKLDIKLQRGVGRVDPSVCFTDSSSCTRSKRFCLGLIPATSDSHVVGAKTEAFTVKTHRSEANKKCENPGVSDKVWLLERISKHGIYRTRLQARGIDSVGDFMKDLESNREELKLLFKPQDFKIMEAHARKCKTNWEDEGLHGTCKNDSSCSNAEALITCLPTLNIDQNGELLKSPNEVLPVFHSQDSASIKEMYTATQQCTSQVHKVPNMKVPLEVPHFEDSNTTFNDGQQRVLHTKVEGDANWEHNDRFGQATLGQIGELHGNPSTKNTKRPGGKIRKQGRPSNPATSSHESQWITMFNPSEMLDSNVLAKDLLMVGNSQTIVCSESHNAITKETIGLPSRSLGHWNDNTTYPSMTLEPQTSNMVIEHNAFKGFQDEFDSIFMNDSPSSNPRSHIGMDVDSNPPMCDSTHGFNHGNILCDSFPSDFEDSRIWDEWYKN